MSRILVIIDELDLVQMCQLILEGHGYEVQTSTSGIQGIEQAFEITPPDLILLDWVIPDMCGDEVFRRLRGDPRTRSIPVVMMSASHKASDAALSLGADDFLSKPFTQEELLSVVTRTLEPDKGETNRPAPL